MAFDSIDEAVKYIVINSRIGRALAHLGGKMTEQETAAVSIVYGMLLKKYKISSKCAATARIGEKQGRVHKISQKEAIEIFIKEYPVESAPLLQIIERKVPAGLPKTILEYGLKSRRDFEAQEYIKIMQEVGNLSEDKANILYHGVLEPRIKEIERKKKRALESMIIKDN